MDENTKLVVIAAISSGATILTTNFKKIIDYFAKKNEADLNAELKEKERLLDIIEEKKVQENIVVEKLLEKLILIVEKTHNILNALSINQDNDHSNLKEQLKEHNDNFLEFLKEFKKEYMEKCIQYEKDKIKIDSLIEMFKERKK